MKACKHVPKVTPENVEACIKAIAGRPCQFRDDWVARIADEMTQIELNRCNLKSLADQIKDGKRPIVFPFWDTEDGPDYPDGNPWHPSLHIAGQKYNMEDLKEVKTEIEGIRSMVDALSDYLEELELDIENSRHEGRYKK